MDPGIEEKLFSVLDAIVKDSVTLRDIFAAFAMAGAASDPELTSTKSVAEWCYKAADALMAARSGGSDAAR